MDLEQSRLLSDSEMSIGVAERPTPRSTLPTPQQCFTGEEISRIIEMAWEDRTPFEAIRTQFGLSQDSVIRIMRAELKPSSFKTWRVRTRRRATKHLLLRLPEMNGGSRHIARHRIPQR